MSELTMCLLSNENECALCAHENTRIRERDVCTSISVSESMNMNESVIEMKCRELKCVCE